ncbi:MAG: helix-turn-helix domain-containing protein [Firmicutes bacterium]|nr:helix-turn-helix domain-containing protein [Bacillota bacterium]MCL2256076.1 helix-turn-helix domain-containing protein [Bacillota bacterium]
MSKKNQKSQNILTNTLEITTSKGEKICIILNEHESIFHIDGKEYVIKQTQSSSNKTLSEKLINFLNGKSTSFEQDELKKEFSGEDFSYYALSIIPNQKEKTNDIIAYLNAVSKEEDKILLISEKTVVFLKKYSPDDDYISAQDFAKILLENIKEELRCELKINVGGHINKFSELEKAYQQSQVAHTFGSMLSPNENVYSYKEFGVAKMLSNIDKETLFNYLTTLIDKKSLEVLYDVESMETANAFLKNSLNISETARTMFLHRNTLIYRLDKIEKITGLDIRNFNDATTFRLISILHKLSSE